MTLTKKEKQELTDLKVELDMMLEEMNEELSSPHYLARAEYEKALEDMMARLARENN